MESLQKPVSLPENRELIKVFLRLGLLGFGGPIAVIAMIEDEVVRKRKWLSDQSFSENYAICKLLPGPLSTQMAISVGRVHAGVWGGIVAGLCFILPSFLMMLGMSVWYVRTGMSASMESFLQGIQCSALSIILVSGWHLTRSFRKNTALIGVAVCSAAVVYVAPSFEPAVILFFGIWGASRVNRSARLLQWNGFPLVWGAGIFAFSMSPLFKVFWVCFKAAAFVFGTGLAVLPVLQEDGVNYYHWLTHSQFMDGLAFGQLTPGPLVITSTFMGYMAAGLGGAFAATLGMFLPSFINVLVLVPRVWKRFAGTAGAREFSIWAIPAVVGGVFATLAHLGNATLHAPLSWVLFLLTGVISLWKNPPAWLLIPSAGVISLLIQLRVHSA